MVARVLVGGKRPRLRGRLVTTAARPVVLPVMNGAGQPAGAVRHGTSRRRPIHAAACRCGTAVYDFPVFEEAARWIRHHLYAAHGIGVVVVDVRGYAERQPPWWQRQVATVVVQIAAVWDDPEAAPLVAAWRADRPAA